MTLAWVVLALPLSDLAVVLAVLLLQGATELVVARNYALALVIVTPLALLVTQLAGPAIHRPLVRDSLVETALGVTIGVVAAVVTRPQQTR